MKIKVKFACSVMIRDFQYESFICHDVTNVCFSVNFRVYQE
jgi:hypothetical protein